LETKCRKQPRVSNPNARYISALLTGNRTADTSENSIIRSLRFRRVREYESILFITVTPVLSGYEKHHVYGKASPDNSPAKIRPFKIHANISP
jgi:hypothetical protein